MSITSQSSIASVIARHLPASLGSEFEAISHHYGQNGQNPFFGLHTGIWILDRIKAEMPFNTCLACERLRAVYTALITRGTQPVTLTDTERAEFADIAADVAIDYTFGVWLKLKKILTSLAHLNIADALEHHLAAVGPRELEPARDKLLNLLRTPPA